ncbi:MAG: ComEA family DNA-binding protein [Candidatus Rokuibacteriota bacterium]
MPAVGAPRYPKGHAARLSETLDVDGVAPRRLNGAARERCRSPLDAEEVMHWHWSTLLVALLIVLLLVAPPFPAAPAGADVAGPKTADAKAGDAKTGQAGGSGTPKTSPARPGADARPAKVVPAKTAGAASVKTVNVNTADVKQLMTLAGVGRRTAERIVEYRQTNGPFKKPEDLQRVDGIGAGLFERNRERIAVK